MWHDRKEVDVGSTVHSTRDLMYKERVGHGWGDCIKEKRKATLLLQHQGKAREMST